MKGIETDDNGAQPDAIDHRNLRSQLLATFPELQSSYNDEASEWHQTGVPGNYTVLGSVFKPRFRQELERGAVSDFLMRSAEFFERVCRTGDAEAINVIWVKVFEWLLPRPDSLRLLWPILGNNTKAAIEDATQLWGYSLEGISKTLLQ